MQFGSNHDIAVITTKQMTNIFVTSGYKRTFSFATTYYNISNYERNL